MLLVSEWFPRWLCSSLWVQRKSQKNHLRFSFWHSSLAAIWLKDLARTARKVCKYRPFFSPLVILKTLKKWRQMQYLPGRPGRQAMINSARKLAHTTCRQCS